MWLVFTKSTVLLDIPTPFTATTDAMKGPHTSGERSEVMGRHWEVL